jgi:hypothetical protein
VLGCLSSVIAYIQPERQAAIITIFKWPVKEFHQIRAHAKIKVATAQIRELNVATLFVDVSTKDERDHASNSAYKNP